MGGSQPSPRALRRAKRGLLKKFGDRAWFRGVAIVPAVGNGQALRINVDPELAPPDHEIPSTYYGIAVEVLKIAGYAPR